MKRALGVTLSLIGLLPWGSGAAASAQSYSIDQTRYFPSYEIEQAELKRRLEEAKTFGR